MDSPGGWLGHSATASKPGWKGSEGRTEAVKTACLLSTRGLLPQPSGDAELNILLLLSCVQGPPVSAHKHSWSHTVFKRTLSNSIQLPALQIELCHPGLCSQTGTYHLVGRGCEVMG